MMRIRIFNLNCWLLPPPISKHNNIRLKRIIKIIKEFNPDIISLQEVWLNKYVKKIESSFKDYKFIKSNSKIYNKSGLLTGFKFKTLNHKILYFPKTDKHSFIETIAKKGAHIVNLSKDIVFVNTQLYAPTIKKETRITLEQLIFIQKKLEKQKVMLTGDLNIEEKDFLKINKIFEYDYNNTFTITKNNPYVVEQDKKIDYVLMSANSNLNLNQKTFSNPIISDHHFIVAEINLTHNFSSFKTP